MPSNYDLLLKSIKKNPSISFLFFTDQKLESRLSNLKYEFLTISKFNQIVKKKIGAKYRIERPYKCCDYRPTFGVLFEDYIKEYDYWGHCDIDLIFGDLRKFITDDLLKKYDKVFPLGHLTLYRNTRKVNNRYRENGSLVGNYDEVFLSQKPFYFDEQNGIGKIYSTNNYPAYNERVFADISNLRHRFVLALDDKNYKHQIFYWENGHVYRAFENNGIIEQDEFVYIHFKRRKNLINYVDNQNAESFYICNKGFISKKIGLPSLNDIKQYNKYYGAIYELLEKNYNLAKLRFKNRVMKVKMILDKSDD